MRLGKAVGAIAAVAAVVAASQAGARELFLKGANAVLSPGSDQVVQVFNGTFEKSQASVARDRIGSISIAAHGHVTSAPDASWHEEKDSAYLRFRTSEAGTYVAGVSTRPTTISMSVADFAKYVAQVGIADAPAALKKTGTGQQVRERYSKHARAVLQVGDKKTADYAKSLGHPLEIAFEQNPYELKFGKDLVFRVLFKGKPVANQLVRASYEGFHGHDASARTSALTICVPTTVAARVCCSAARHSGISRWSTFRRSMTRRQTTSRTGRRSLLR